MKTVSKFYGLLLVLSVFFAGCGSGPNNIKDEAAEEKLSVLIIHRPFDYVGGNKKFDIILDGKKAGEVGDFEDFTIKITNGSHSLYTRAGLKRSNRINFQVNSEEKIFITAYSGNSIRIAPGKRNPEYDEPQKNIADAKNINPDDFGIRFTEASAGFSMYAPKGWKIVDTGQKYKALTGAAEDNFSPIIIFNDEPFTGKISDYIDTCLELFSQILADFELLERTDFTTNSGLQGGCITIQGRLNDIQARQKIYFIPNKRNTAITGITCAVSPATGTKYDTIFDNCVETFEWSK
jgi:hypothetical protein